MVDGCTVFALSQAGHAYLGAFTNGGLKLSFCLWHNMPVHFTCKPALPEVCSNDPPMLFPPCG